MQVGPDVYPQAHAPFVTKNARKSAQKPVNNCYKQHFVTTDFGKFHNSTNSGSDNNRQQKRADFDCAPKKSQQKTTTHI